LATLTIETSEGKISYEFAQMDANTFAARRVGEQATCVIPETALRSIAAPFDKRVLAFSASAFDLVGGPSRRSFAFDATDNTWHLSPDSATPGARLLSARVGEAVTNLRVLGLVHAGAAMTNEGFDLPTLTIASAQKTLKFGALSRWDHALGYFARVNALNATFFVLAGDVDAIRSVL
jgi:hypothetical protein